MILVDNGGCEREFLRNLADLGITYIDCKGNKGLGAALNIGFQIASDSGLEFVVMFDQDSAPSHDHVSKLFSAHELITKIIQHVLRRSLVF